MQHNVNNSFDISILESKEFYSGLLTPVDLATVNYFGRQGYSRQLAVLAVRRIDPRDVQRQDLRIPKRPHYGPFVRPGFSPQDTLLQRLINDALAKRSDHAD